ncbi:MAG TPA: excinuclease ABC subunit A [Marinilabiliales bacterium]|nr:MAG: excinuclease ABC subunit A [Bacteroidetes bacterium GWA2_40_14]OFX57043.1 MAG: excinuclease ABC subunit A [Bacteroidetes bacterium GWC2_40_13]OFX72169.1 MAG: excinuclease ABC subunit A [Bacteroidetes bacterium GWD2_40_43]OFX94235.1 MAG: excinuclease ABC subunit A [Bacteroidetes bacterium GWE2_40_63]OFY23696.1 MAG: excinuclease ABC subunit A [Bacteroidetes bacterium GWF2_40_13]OFZ25230.1 MAG: excinuclease ABC subunit A [Bacteroidetes bacterium RIFOXYC2_FULL_40_12]HAM99289.1 excinucleas
MTTHKTNEKFIQIKAARVHNLKNISLNIPLNKLVVITGLSGSGKSSLAFDTLYAEGQRRYVESLSSYARQFLGRVHKPEVDFIKGIPPAIAIEQKVNTRNPRSTVGTSTEIYDYFKLLYARIGKTISPISGQLVKKQHPDDVVDYLMSFPLETKALILAPIQNGNKRPLQQTLDILKQQGFSRIEINNEILKIEDFNLEKTNEDIHIVIDRVVVSQTTDTVSRITDSAQTAFFEGHGTCLVRVFLEDSFTDQVFSNQFEADGMLFDEPSVHMFSFNNPLGACPRCEGFGLTIGIDEDLVIPNKSLSIYQDAVACWRGEKMNEWKDELIHHAGKFDFPIHKPISQFTEWEMELLWNGNSYFQGLHRFFAFLEENSYKIQYRVMLSRYRGRTTCPECKGSRLKKETNFVKVAGKTLSELVVMPIDELSAFISNVELDVHDKKIAERLFIEIKSRIRFLLDVGLGYLTLNRLSSSLSGGESQRINLATSLGSSLVGSLYILDEPSIGLHSKDTELLIKVLRNLQQLGNTVVVVEHDEEIIRAADEIIDIGPLAGAHGGEVVFQGNSSQLLESKQSLTTKYLTGQLKIPVPKMRRKWNNYIGITGARENNLKNLDVKFPLNTMTVVTGVSGSGKSSLINKVFYTALKKRYGGHGDESGHFDKLVGDMHLIADVEFVDQNPIGKSSRSNPVTYIKAYDEIRKLFSEQKASKLMGFTPSHFSFNVDGGRCEECQGEGTIKVEMQFMADIELECESCKGKRFKQDVLEVTYHHKNIYEVLDLTVNEAMDFFNEKPTSLTQKITKRLQTLVDVGLGYVKLGQSSSTLSGGESQRIKLASFLSRERDDQPLLFIFDEPTTGLHFHDINNLLKSFNALIEKGNSVLIIEHNPEIIKNADWVIDLGPEGGKKGGHLVFEGTPENLIKCEPSFTGKFLREKL